MLKNKTEHETRQKLWRHSICRQDGRKIHISVASVRPSELHKMPLIWDTENCVASCNCRRLATGGSTRHAPFCFMLLLLFYCSLRSQLLAINFSAGTQFCVLSEHLPVMLQELYMLNLPKHAPYKTLRFLHLKVRIQVAIYPGFITDSSVQNPS